MTRRVLALVACAALTACDATAPGSAVGNPTTETTTTITTTVPTTTSSSACDYRETPDDPPADGRDVDLPSGEDAPATVTLATNHGEITMTMAVDDAPCTTASIAHLAKSGFYDDGPCHRMTKAPSLSVLQCGDPSGTGNGGPGYTLPDENPTGLAPAENPEYVIYPRGTVAMANAGRPHSGGSQFFLVYAESVLPPTYAVFASMDEKSLAILDKIADGGIDGGDQDGKPTLAVTIEKATAN